jgi:hypothetical protein
VRSPHYLLASLPVAFSDYRQCHSLLVHKAVIGVEPHVLAVAALQKLPSSRLQLASILLMAILFMPSITWETPLSPGLPAWCGWGFNVALGKVTEILKEFENLFGPRLLSLRPTRNVELLNVPHPLEPVHVVFLVAWLSSRTHAHLSCVYSAATCSMRTAVLMV